MYKEDLTALFDKLGFKQNEIGYHKEGYSFYISNVITCVNATGVKIFEVEAHISLGTFLVLLQEYQIVHERYIYETVEGIEERFNDDED
jgi:hypothetical protein